MTFLGGTLGEYNLFIRVSSLQAATLTNSLETRAQTIKALQNIAEFSKLHGMKTAHHVALDAANSCLEYLAPSIPTDISRASRVATAIEGAVRAFIADAQSRQFFAADAMADGYYETADKLVGAEVVDQFPSIQFDIEEAGKCLTFGLWTASVMHLMRVHECVLGVLAQHLGVEVKENWNSTLNDIEAALRQIKASKEGPVAEQAAAEAATHLRFVKNAHRNHVMHAHMSYDQKRARDVFDGTRAFLQHLAKALSGDAFTPHGR